MRAGVLVVAMVVSISAAACAAGAAPSSTPLGSAAEPGTERAPDFTVETFGGGTFSLAEHLSDDGRPVFLNLWASWCLPCREEMPVLDAAARRHPGVRFVGVAVQDSLGDATAFAEEIAVGYTLGFDGEDAVDDGYLPLGLPVSYLISADGFLLEELYGQLSDEVIDQKLALWFGG